MQKSTLLILFVSMISCDPMLFDHPFSNDNDDNIYKIPQGSHYSDQSDYETFQINSLHFKFKFDSSAIYTTQDPKNQGDINKLFGLSDCNDFHHKNSARFGWRWYDKKLELWAYGYHDGNREYQLIDTVALYQNYTASIEFKDQQYQFIFEDKIIKLPRSCDSVATGYKLYPYFGGEETAPHDITIEINELTAPAFDS